MLKAAATHTGNEQRLSLRQVLHELVQDGLIGAAQAQELMSRRAARAQPEQHPLVTVSECDWHDARRPAQQLSLEFLVQWLAERSGLPYFRIDPLSIDVTGITAVTPYAYAARVGILPVKVTATEITVATAEPLLREWERELAQVTGKAIKRVLANPRDIERYLVEFYALARSVKASSEQNKNRLPGLSNLEQLVDLSRSGKLDAKDQHVVSIVDWLLQYAFDQRASDIHLEPRREQGNVRFRIDGVLHDVYQMPALVMTAVVSRLKVLARMDLAEKRRPQDGRIKTRSPDGREIELRVSALPTAFGEKLVLRIFDPQVLVKDYAQLGFAERDIARWEAMVREPHGIVLVTGPTGSGKTTTLYSTLKTLATPEVNVCSIEDPIELVDPAFNQMQVQPGIELTFAAGVRALLRQDPDIIMIGEIRDLETAEIAVQAALTGHLVLSTLHTNDAPTAITRLLDLGVPHYLLKATVLGVVAQRLVRTLCPHCKQPVEPQPAAWQELTGAWKLPLPPQIFEANGCLECRATGYLGRSGIYEMMPLTPALKRIINDQTDLAALRLAAYKDGMLPLRIAGAQKVAAGVTSVDEVLTAAPSLAAAE
jgi:general secretion pathway protein E